MCYNVVMAVKKFKNVNWQADEHILRDKGNGWFVGMLLMVVGLVALAAWFEWWTFVALIVVSAIAMLVYVLRPPRKIHYSIGLDGLSEGSRLYDFSDFRAFSLTKEGGVYMFVLTPIKRFSGKMMVIFPEELGEQIVDILGARLPMEDFKMDLVDKIVKFLRI